MALAKKCDICGRLYEHYILGDGINGIATVRLNKGDGYNMIDVLDCCPQCMESIQSELKFMGAQK